MNTASENISSENKKAKVNPPLTENPPKKSIFSLSAHEVIERFKEELAEFKKRNNLTR